MNLFDHSRQKQLRTEAPLAARMRPRTLDQFVGQSHIVGAGRLLHRAIQADQLSSLIFYGPPGTGKTTLARIIANTTQAHFIALNAVLGGVKDIRAAIEQAKDQRGMYRRRTILFVDEVHRFNKAQQDALLPHVENGTVVFIGATTENPYFEVNRALVSRSRIFELRQLDDSDLAQVLEQALTDSERGYGQKKIDVELSAREHLLNSANGDARALLNALELAVETTPVDDDGGITITLAVAEESIQQKAVLYDKDGDIHFDTISAFVKSLRGSDPDAALYWLAKMVYAGEDSRFIFRRMLIFASEDVGLADPNALPVVSAAAQAFDYVGLPEGRFHLAQACLYLATAPKSNTSFSFFDALNAVAQEQEAEVPNHLKDANRDGEDLGHGKGYMYPHAYRNHWVAQQYLPSSLQGRLFYQPSQQGYEATIHTQVAQRREAQLAAMLEQASSLDGVLAQARTGVPTANRWLQRTLSNVGEQLGQLRDKLFALADVARHHLVLDVQAGTGLLLWEAVRRANVGGVYGLAHNAQTLTALTEQSQQLEPLERPRVLLGTLQDLSGPFQAEALQFERIIGRNALTRLPDKATALARLIPFLTGRLVLVETVPRETQRLHQLVNLPVELAEIVQQTEDAIYTNPTDPMVNWTAVDLPRWLEAAGLHQVQSFVEPLTSERHIDRGQLNRWFDVTATGPRLTFAQHLQQAGLSPTDLQQVKTQFERQLLGQMVAWQTTVCFVVGE